MFLSIISCEVKGDVTSSEEVVVDFGTLKKSIVHIIDSLLDHRYWCFDQSLEYRVDSLGRDMVVVKSSKFNAVVPHNAVFDVMLWADKNWDALNQDSKDFMLGVPTHLVSKKYLRHLINIILSIELQKVYPDINLAVGVYINGDSNTPHLCGLNTVHNRGIRYTHGLEHSTSIPCRNPIHGHKSFIYLHATYERKNTGINQLATQRQVCASLWRQFNHAVFVNKQHTKVFDNGDVKVSYTVDGIYYDVIHSHEANIHQLDGETTIENLIEYICSHVDLNVLRDSGIKAISISEGINKGAVKYL